MGPRADTPAPAVLATPELVSTADDGFEAVERSFFDSAPSEGEPVYDEPEPISQRLTARLRAGMARLAAMSAVVRLRSSPGGLRALGHAVQQSRHLAALSTLFRRHLVGPRRYAAAALGLFLATGVGAWALPAGGPPEPTKAVVSEKPVARPEETADRRQPAVRAPKKTARLAARAASPPRVRAVKPAAHGTRPSRR